MPGLPVSASGDLARSLPALRLRSLRLDMTNVPPISDVRGDETGDHGGYDQRGVTGCPGRIAWLASVCVRMTRLA